ncbi:hypothetical protein KSP39_PZI000787 [Platanthera zijinensis]|uniref:Uncharacterized protein n=1 Tax=Platanthera zijinensis TaxID=2320716 RepID=A0AAP0GFB1_9ASPA
MSPEQFQYIWRKTIPHIEVGMGSGVFQTERLGRSLFTFDFHSLPKKPEEKRESSWKTGKHVKDKPSRKAKSKKVVQRGRAKEEKPRRSQHER